MELKVLPFAKLLVKRPRLIFLVLVPIACLGVFSLGYMACSVFSDHCNKCLSSTERVINGLLLKKRLENGNRQ